MGVRQTVKALRVDLVVYLGFAAFALATALASEYYGHRVWGNFAAAGYGLAAAHTVVLLATARKSEHPGARWASRWTGVAVAFLIGMLAPLLYLVIRRLDGLDWLDTPRSWAAQPEVWVIERSATLLLHTGTPYVDVTALGRPPEVDDYTPYGPVMPVFGLPRAVLHELGWSSSATGQALTDARMVFAVVACTCVVLCLRLLGRPQVPVAAAHLAVVSPATALTWAVAGPDLAILGLLLLSVVLATTGRPGWAGFVLALVVSAKLTAAPAVLVIAIMLGVRGGMRAVLLFAGTLLAACAALTIPALVIDAHAFFEHVVAFPAGSGTVPSPAASPLPGHLLAGIGPAGHTIALVLLGLAALTITAWLVLRPPATGGDAMLRIAVGLGTATLLTPATRWGYLVYPLVLLGARLAVPEDADRVPPATSSSV